MTLRTTTTTAKTAPIAPHALGHKRDAASAAAAKLLGLPVRGIEKLGAAVIKWLEGPPESDTAWMHSTNFGSDRIRQECIDGFWEEKEAAAKKAKAGG